MLHQNSQCTFPYITSISSGDAYFENVHQQKNGLHISQYTDRR